MVRTGDRCVRIGGGKSSAKKGGGGASSGSTPKSKSSSSKSNSSIGGNPVCPRETPNWQKPITSFFQKKDPVESSNDDESRNSEVSCSKDTFKDSPENNSPEHTAISKHLPIKEAPPNNDVNNKPSNDEIPSTSQNKTPLEESEPNHTNGIQSVCKTPTSERKRKSNINILTPKRIQSHS